jgi:putative transposase
MTTQTYRRARHSVSLLHAHLVFVTKYRRKVVTDAMLTPCENTMRGGCDDLDAELVEINGEADHVHLLVAYPPTQAIATIVQRLNGPHRSRRTPRIHRRLGPRPHPRPPLVAVLLRRLLRRRSTVDHQATHRRTSPTTPSAGLRPPTQRDGLTPP